MRGAAAILFGLVMALLAAAAVAAGAAGQCVEDTPTMRRNHMDMLKHQRKTTVHEGIRTTQHSLAGCVACHADPATRRVAGSRDAFCETCHRYAAVQLDCWDCHSDRAGDGAGLGRVATPTTGARP